MLTLILGVPVTVKVLTVLAAFLLFYRLSKNMAFSIALGVLLLSFWLGHPLSELLRVSAARTFSRGSYELMLVIFLVIFLSQIMEETGFMKDLVSGIERIFPPRAAVAALPAAIGLLPMPGGAIFSAPLIDQYDRDHHLTGERKTHINYWFRHIWEGWWPLYPGVILAIDLSGVPLPVFSSLMMFITLAAVLAGYLVFLRGVKLEKSAAPETAPETSPSLFASLSPILVVVAVYAPGRAFFPGLGSYLPLIAGLLLSLTMIRIRRPLPLQTLLRRAFTGKALNMILIVMLVRIYGAVIEVPLPGGTVVTEAMRLELISRGIPPFLMILILPFITGVATGISLGFVGASFPIVLTLLPADAYTTGVMAAYLAGFIGIMVSPVHVCLVVTNKHFNTSLGGSLTGVGAAAVMLAFLGLSYLAGLHLLFGF